MTWDYCVVGNGPLGAAVALELARASATVCVLGARHGEAGAFFSGHDDDSRIARLYHGGDAQWEELAARNVPMLAALAASTGVEVFRTMPVLYRFGSGTVPASPLLRPCDEADACEGFSRQDAGGGLIDPQRYVAAMNMAALARGARVCVGAVHSIERHADGGFVLQTATESVRARRVVDARGCHQPQLPAGGGVVGKVFVLAESGADARPPQAFVDHAPEEQPLREVYGFRRHRRSQGRSVFKFGMSEREPVRLAAREVADWFLGGYREHPGLPALRNWIARRHPRLRVVGLKPCAFVATSTGRPFLRYEQGRLLVTGCNGMAAKACQSIAESAVSLMRTAA